MRTRRAFLLLLTAATASAHAAPVTPGVYKSQLAQIRHMLDQCMVESKACETAMIGPDDQVSADPSSKGTAFQVQWDWLRAVVRETAQDKPADSAQRQQRLVDAEARIAALEQDTQPTPHDDAKARAQADRILAQPEFRHVQEVSWWDRQMARFWNWLSRAFRGLDGVGPYVAWLAPVLEWGTILLAGAGLLFWFWRVQQRQRFALALEAPQRKGKWQEVSRQWAETARQAAAVSDWREAVHALYWASVVELEGRNVWRQHRGRTPREYLRLLDPASPYHPPIQQMTRIFERIWYGLRPASPEDYTRVLALYDAMRAA